MYRYKLAGQNDKPVYELLYEYIRNDILTGKLVSGDRLPSKRNMASDNGISVTTVVNAYNQLLMEGYIKSFEKKGYFVSDISALPRVKKKNLYENPVYVEDNWFADFGSNNILYKNFPHFTWKKVVREVLSTYETELIMRGHPFGNEELKYEIADYLYRNRGITVSPELIVIGAGIEFLYNRLINVLPSSSTYAVENPGYKKIPKLYNSFSLNWKSIDMDDEGINMRDLETVNPNIVHVSPEHHYPLGTFMPLKRRQELLAWGCGAANRYIIEDDFDCEFRYGSKPMPALKSLDVCEKVIYMNTFSKTLSPAIRISYMVLPEKLMRKYIENTYFFTNSASTLEQLALALFIKKGYFERHIRRIKKLYRQEGETLREILLTNKDIPIISLSETQNGTHILVKLQTELSDDEVREKTVKKGVQVNFLSDFCTKPEAKYEHTLILNFSDLDEDTQREAISRLGSVFTGTT